MRVMVLVKATKDSEAGKPPEEKLILETMKLNEELMKAGVLLDAGGLWPSSQGKRIRLEGETRAITDGRFAETKELVGGYWMLQANSFDEVVEWMKRFPLDRNGCELEIRRLIDVGDFAEGEEANAMHERLEKQVGRETERHVQLAVMSFDERMREVREEAASRLGRELDRAVEVLAQDELARRLGA